MADVKFKTGAESELPAALNNGTILVAKGGKGTGVDHYHGKIYFDTDSYRFLLTNNIASITQEVKENGTLISILTEQGLTSEFLIANASALTPGLVSTGTQTLAGPKTFIDEIIITNSTNTLEPKLTVDGKAVIGKLNLSNLNGISYGTEDPPTDNVVEGDVYFKLIT